jgi:di/tripeptidase
VPGMVADKTLNNVHGLNERISVTNLYTTRDYLFDLINAYAAK